MRNVFAVALIAAALGAGMTHAQNPAPANVTVKEVQPGLLEATGPRVHDAVVPMAIDKAKSQKEGRLKS